MMKKAEIWLTRSYWDLEFPRKILPNVDFIGGHHCKPSKPLPKVNKCLFVCFYLVSFYFIFNDFFIVQLHCFSSFSVKDIRSEVVSPTNEKDKNYYKVTCFCISTIREQQRPWKYTEESALLNQLNSSCWKASLIIKKL